MTYSEVIKAIAKDEESYKELNDRCITEILIMEVEPYESNERCKKFLNCPECERNVYQGEKLRKTVEHLVNLDKFEKIRLDYYVSKTLEPEQVKQDHLTKNDAVNHPSHYNFGRFEVIDVIEDWKLGFNLGNVIKYIARADHKGKRNEDLKKALFYLQREVNNNGK